MEISIESVPAIVHPGRLHWPQIRRPRLDTARYVAPRTAAAPAGNVHPLLSYLCVLVVDDNPVNLLLAAEMMSLWGIRPLQAADGDEAVALVRELRFDLILMDLQMPVLDGLAATRRIRRLERGHSRPRVPIVAYTSWGTGVDPMRLQECGIDAALDKPCRPQALHDCLVRWCLPELEPTPVARMDPGPARHLD